MSPRLAMCLVCAALAAALAGAGPAVAAWNAPRWVSADGWSATDEPAVAAGPHGGAVLAWQACDGRLPVCDYRVQVRTQNPGGGLGPILALSQPGAVPSGPQLAVDRDGDALVVWQQHDATANWRVAARQVRRGGSPGPIMLLSPAGPIAASPRVAVAAAGRSLVAWSEYRAGGWYTVARRVSRAGAVGRRLELGAGSAEPPTVAVDGRGAFVVAWTDFRRVLARRIGRAVSATRVVASVSGTGERLALVRAGAARDGDVLLAFKSADDERSRLWARRWLRSGALGPRRALSPRRHFVGLHVALAIDREGHAVVAWTRWLPDDRFAVYGRQMSRAGAFRRVARLGRGSRPDVALDDDGDGVVVWQHPDDDLATAVRGRTVARGGGFGPQRTVGPGGRAPDAAAHPDRRAVVVWQQVAPPYRIGMTSR